MSENLINYIVEMQEDEAIDEVQKLIDSNYDVMDILGKCREAMELVGQRYENGEYFVPQLMMAAEIMNQITEMTKDLIENESEESTIGTILMGTVAGDIHDIGKGIVDFNLEVNGFKIIDIGEDVSPENFIKAINQYNPDIVGMSCLLTVAFESMKDTVKKIDQAGLRDQVKIMIGGAPINDDICEYVQADGWAADAVKAVRLAKKWMGE